MEIEIKKVSFNPRIDTHSFAANLVIDGIKAGNIVSNHMGTHYYPLNDKGHALIEKAEKYCAKLPAKSIVVDGKPQQSAQSLKSLIGDLFSAHLERLEHAKYFKKVDVAMKQSIVIGEPTKYIRTVRTKAPIDILTKSESGTELLKSTIIQEVLPTLSDNEKLLNSNIPVIILKAAGLKEDQFIKQSVEYLMKPVPQKAKSKGI
ncbi:MULTISPECIES: hypothetical protein [Sphingobacterium]|uniref:hypothetical protein n=1 Tax=Sphingobacterium TaxID=28453 RepID=UPI0008A61CDE|nr:MULTISPECIES: hypothetical protein [Sphingobacterium]MBB1642708.1 hypothetical protein [Sphingobacterium sp. UME9]OFV09573.1 hypothetical protein HMPREF3127_23195 [Sphingobacterium sp. HMSC13C05]